VGEAGAIVGRHTFRASAPLKQLLRKFGFTPERVTQIAREQVAANTRPPEAASPGPGKEGT